MSSKQKKPNLPMNDDTHIMEEEARGKVIDIFKSFHYVVGSIHSDRRQCDYGEDLDVHICHPEHKVMLPYKFCVQSKDRNCVEKVGDNYIKCSVETKHINKWKNDKIPVLFTLWDKASDKTFWLIIQDYVEQCKEKSGDNFSKKLKKQKEITIYIPLSNVLDSDGVKIITVRVIDRYESYRDETPIKMLEELLYETMPGRELSIRDYDAGVIGLKMPSGDLNVRLFGEIIDDLTEIASLLNSTVQDVADHIPDYCKLLLEKKRQFDNNGKFTFMIAGKEFLTIEDWFNWIDSMSDLSRYEEVMSRAVEID